MKYLLDTHALLWAIYAPANLSRPARAAIRDPNHECYVSAASAWEIATKHRLGKLDGVEALVNGFDAVVAQMGFRELPITGRHGIRSALYSTKHRDPFDRMLAAQAELEALALVTKDRAIMRQFKVRIHW